MAEYCDTPQSKEKRHWENKACLNERAILRLLDHEVTWKPGRFLAPERGDISSVMSLMHSFFLRYFFLQQLINVFGGHATNGCQYQSIELNLIS